MELPQDQQRSSRYAAYAALSGTSLIQAPRSGDGRQGLSPEIAAERQTAVNLAKPVHQRAETLHQPLAEYGSQCLSEIDGLTWLANLLPSPRRTSSVKFETGRLIRLSHRQGLRRDGAAPCHFFRRCDAEEDWAEPAFVARV